jgi:tetratricopeptide (TPR) repeat protein
VNDLPLSDEAARPAAAAAFISYATADRKQALSVCSALEKRGTRCWISCRDVAPGENYQEAIVRAIRGAGAVVLIFSKAANTSDEIKKELSLASRYRVPVFALRTDDVESSDAFAYELSTRQWIDAFNGWDKAIDSLSAQLVETSPAKPGEKPLRQSGSRRPLLIAALTSLLLIVVAGAAWLLLRPAATPAHSMTVRLSGFRILSADLPPTLRDAVDAEIAAAFNADGVVGVSTASAPPDGSAPAYALGGTIQRDRNAVRVITRLTNERSGTTLWSGHFDYDGNEVARVPRHIAVDAGNIVRCGLFGASTYSRPLPDGVMRDYLQFCQGHWDPVMTEGRKALVPAQRVVAAVPDFSWGWAAVAGGWWKVAFSADNEKAAEEARASGREAADRAVAIDSRNSEALYIKAQMIDRRDWVGRESLFKRAIAARRLDCGCEHHQYGTMLTNVGRVTDALTELRQANDMLALYVYTPLELARALVVAGKAEEARTYFDAAIDLAPNADFAQGLSAYKASQLADVAALRNPKLPLSDKTRAALLAGFQAAAFKDSGARSRAVRTLLALPAPQQNDGVARLLANLGAPHEALQVAARLADREFPGPTVFWYPSMRRALFDPAFPAIAEKLGLMRYWKTSRTKPDVCATKDPPPFCKMI